MAFVQRALRVLCLVLLQKLHQRFHALLGHGIVDGCPETADALVALQVVETGGFGSGHHLGVLLLGGGDEGNIHIGAILFPNSAGEELALVQKIVQ